MIAWNKWPESKNCSWNTTGLCNSDGEAAKNYKNTFCVIKQEDILFRQARRKRENVERRMIWPSCQV